MQLDQFKETCSKEVLACTFCVVCILADPATGNNFVVFVNWNPAVTDQIRHNRFRDRFVRCRRYLNCSLADYYLPSVFDEEYSYSPSGIYKCPPGNPEYDEILEYINGLPLTQVRGRESKLEQCAPSKVFAHLELESQFWP